jgi:hypothetical protein
MKHSLKAIRSMVAALLLVIAIQAPVFAENNDNTTASSGLSASGVIGSFVLLLFVILAPLAKKGTIKQAHIIERREN